MFRLWLNFICELSRVPRFTTANEDVLETSNQTTTNGFLLQTNGRFKAVPSMKIPKEVIRCGVKNVGAVSKIVRDFGTGVHHQL